MFNCEEVGAVGAIGVDRSRNPIGDKNESILRHDTKSKRILYCKRRLFAIFVSERHCEAVELDP